MSKSMHNNSDRIQMYEKAGDGDCSTSSDSPAPRDNELVPRLHKKAISLLKKLSTFFFFLRRVGFKRTMRITRSKLTATQRIKKMLSLKETEIAAQKSTTFDHAPTISIIVPLYNTNSSQLKETLESVVSQTYSNWELILIDASDSKYLEAEIICTNYAQVDDRIIYKRLATNLGIADNTNAGLEISTGDYITLLDHDDVLHQSALYEITREINNTNADLIYTDELVFYDSLNSNFSPHFKPDYSPDTLRSYNYICHMLVYSRDLHKMIGGMRSECSGSQDYDLALRLSEYANTIVHIPKLLYFWRRHEESYSQNNVQRDLCITAAKKALADHLERTGLIGEVFDADINTCYRIKYEILERPLISIIIPNCDHITDLRTCIDSIITKSTYQNYEILIVENNSSSPETFEFYNQIKNSNISVLHYPDTFNYSAINNFAAKRAKGEYLIFLNNDTEVISPDWIEELLMIAQRDDVGAVGAKLYYPDDTIQHAGVILGIGGTAGHAFRGFKRSEDGYYNRLKLTQNISVVTGACFMLSKSKYDEVDGFDESFVVALNDVDLCLKLREHGLLNVFSPYAELYHFESKSRGYEDSSEKKMRLAEETDQFHKKWGTVLANGDPYYNPNLTLDLEDFSIA